MIRTLGDTWPVSGRTVFHPGDPGYEALMRGLAPGEAALERFRREDQVRAFAALRLQDLLMD